MTTMPHGMDQQVFLQTLAFGGKNRTNSIFRTDFSVYTLYIVVLLSTTIHGTYTQGRRAEGVRYLLQLFEITE